MFGLFQRKNRKKAENSHDFDATDRENALEVRRLNSEMKQMQKKIQLEKMRNQIAELRSQYEDERGEEYEPEESLDPMEHMAVAMMQKLIAGQQPAQHPQEPPIGESPPSPQTPLPYEKGSLMSMIDLSKFQSLTNKEKISLVKLYNKIKKEDVKTENPIIAT